VLVWNERPPVPGFMAGYEDLVARYAAEHPPIEAPSMASFFQNKTRQLATLPNQRQLDLAGLRGRFLSSSYAPLPGAPEYEPSLEALAQLF
jgi:hypothetical protein